MEFIKGFIEWVVSNKENLATFIILLGATVEALNALIPTPNKDSALEKVGRLLSKLTGKLPSNIKKVEVVKKDDQQS